MIDVKIEITMKGDLYKWTDAISGWKLTYAEIQNGELLCYDKKDGNLQNTVSLINGRQCKLSEYKLSLLDSNISL